MKNKAILFSFIALLAIVLALNTVTAFATIDEVEVNGVTLGSGVTSVGHVSKTIPIEVKFTADNDLSGYDTDDKVKVKVYIEGFKSDIYVSKTLTTALESNVTYVERFKLTLPSSMDLDEDLSKELILHVEIVVDQEIVDEDNEDLKINLQRDLYSLNILSIEADDEVIAGKTVAVDVVLQNNGHERLDNVYIKASIPELGIERKVYAGDISPNAEDDYDDIRDAVNKKVYLTIPRNSIPGIYNIEVEAYNYDTTVTAKNKIVISGVKTGVLPTITAKAISVGQEATFDVVLINPNDRMVVYSVTPADESKGLIVDVTESIVTVPADSSRTVKVRVKATSSVEEGTHLVTVNVNSESGFIKQVPFTVNVENPKADDAVLTLTAVLAIIFVVLLIVLIVLLVRKPAEPEEFGETSYY